MQTIRTGEAVMKGSIASEKSGLQIILKTIEGDDRPIYLVGNFNNWQTKQESFRLSRQGKGVFVFHFHADFPLPNPLEYKYVRGDWDDEELDHNGNKVYNRTIANPSGVIRDEVPRWLYDGQVYKKEFLPIPHILSENFEIPQLIKTRRIAALLPHDYHQSNKRYPVLYLQDGQNLFDKHARYGSWGVTKKLAVLAEQGKADIIVVAIDHAEEERIEEFTPSQRTKLGIGTGKKYVRFLADTLKPYIDKNFRTLPEAEHTGIGGSSMGGLISLYAGMMYPEVYSKWMIFSPSIWVAPNLPFDATDLYTDYDRRIYLYAGDQESDKLVERMKELRDTLQGNHHPEVKVQLHLSIRPGGKHNEHNWGLEFPKAVEWLFFHES